MSIYFDILSCVLSAVTLLIVSKHVPIADVHEPHVNPPISSDVQELQELTTYELERLEREESFDKRIAQIKEELANQQTFIRNASQNADELHPLVKNLPHNTITDTQQPPDIEYAD